MGIQVKVYLPVIHLQPFMKKMYGYQKGDFPVSELVSSQTLALPFYIGLTKKDVEYISEKIKKLVK
jgi:perosamine synthetase